MRIRQLLSEIKTPVQRALDCISPHFAEIQAAWRKRLTSAGIDEYAWKVLFPLTLEAQRQNLGLGNLDAYRQEL